MNAMQTLPVDSTGTFFAPPSPLDDPTPMTLIGTELDDVFGGGLGNDYLEGGGGNDSLRGGGGDDIVIGGAGDDYLHADRYSAEARDTAENANLLIGGAGDDLMLSGGGADVFAFGDASGYDIVENFHVGSDVVAIQMGVNGTGANDAFDLAFYQTEAGSTVLDLGGGNMVELYGVQLADLSVDNFLFV